MVGPVGQKINGWLRRSETQWLTPSVRKTMVGPVGQKWNGWPHQSEIQWLAPSVRKAMVGPVGQKGNGCPTEQSGTVFLAYTARIDTVKTEKLQASDLQKQAGQAARPELVARHVVPHEGVCGGFMLGWGFL